MVLDLVHDNFFQKGIDMGRKFKAIASFACAALIIGTIMLLYNDSVIDGIAMIFPIYALILLVEIVAFIYFLIGALRKQRK